MTTISLKRPLGAAAGALGLALVASLLSPVAANAAGTYDDRTALTQGHADVFYLVKNTDGHGELVAHTDDYGDLDPSEVVIHGKPSVATRTAGANVANFLGISQGDEYYLLPQTNQVGELFLGFGYNTDVSGGTGWAPNSINVTYTISDFEGPGTFALWQSGEDGPEQWVHSANEDWSFTSTANHEHLAWGFTAQGTYTFDMTASYVEGGVTHTTDTHSYVIHIGEELPQDGGVTDPDTSVSISGVSDHYHTGGIVSLIADVTDAPDTATYEWFTRSGSDSEWTSVSGVTGASYGFIAIADQEVKVAVKNEAGTVIAESDPVTIELDDHGSTPVSGPTVSTELQATEGALVISVAAGSEHSQLSDLTLNANADRFVATGEIGGITVTDTRQSDPGWQANGRIRGLVASDGSSISGTYVGWTPNVLSSSAGQNVVAGAEVEPGLDSGSGISSWSGLASTASGSGRGTAVLGAEIRIEAPTTTAVGAYEGLILLTVI